MKQRIIAFFSLGLSLLTSMTAQADFVPVDALMRNDSHFGVSLSPDGSLLAYVQITATGASVNLLELDTREKHQLFYDRSQAQSRFSGISWIDNDTFLLHERQSGKKQGSLYNLSKQQQEMVLEPLGQIDPNDVLDYLPNIDDQLLVMADPSWFSGKGAYRINPQQPIDAQLNSDNRISGNISDAFSFIASRDGVIRVALTSDEDKLMLWVRDSAEDPWRKKMTFNAIDVAFYPVGGIDSERIAVLSDHQSDTIGVFAYNFVTNEIEEALYLHPRYDVESAGLDGRGNLSYVTYQSQGREVTRYFQEQDQVQAEKLRATLGDKDFNIVASSLDGETQVLLGYSETQVDSFYLFTPSSGRAQYLFSSNDQIATLSFAPSQSLKVMAEDGLEIEALLTVPENANGALLVFPHGGPLYVQDTAEFNTDVNYFSNRGFSVLRVNYRGSGGRGNDFVQAGVGQQGSLIEADIQAALVQVQKQHAFKHVCAMGESYGGFAALTLPLNYPDSYDCAISGFGVSDLSLLYNENNYVVHTELRKSIELVYGDAPDQDLKLASLSPFRRAADMPVPVLLYGGVKDQVVDVEHLNRMALQLRRHNKPVEYVLYPRSGHGHSNWIPERHELTLIEFFLRKTLNLPAPASQADRVLLGNQLGEAAKLDIKRSKKRRWVFQAPHIATQMLEMGVGLEAPEAYAYAAETYRYGLNVPMDETKAFELYRKAHLGGSDYGSFMYAVHLFEGITAAQDKAQAKTIIQDLASRGGKFAVQAKNMQALFDVSVQLAALGEDPNYDGLTQAQWRDVRLAMRSQRWCKVAYRMGYEIWRVGQSQPVASAGARIGCPQALRGSSEQHHGELKMGFSTPPEAGEYQFRAMIDGVVITTFAFTVLP